MTLNELSCTECENESKYKCPKCQSRYCSVNCYKEHKLYNCKPELVKVKKQTPPKINQLNYQFETEDTVPVEKLELLKSNKQLIEILGNPHVRHIMESINNSPSPKQLVHNAMLEPIFVEFVDECLKVIEPK